MQNNSIPSIDRIVNASQSNDSQELQALASEMLLLGSKDNKYSTLLKQIEGLYHGLEDAFSRRKASNPRDQAGKALRRLGYKAAVRAPVEGDRVFMAIHETAYSSLR